MYFCAIASTWFLRSRAKAFSYRVRSSSVSASVSRSKLSSGNFASIGTRRSTLITASTRSPVLKPYCSWYESCGRRSRRRLPSSSSPKPPRAFGGRSACSSFFRSFARARISAFACPSWPSCWWIADVVFVVVSRRRSIVAVIASSRRSTSALRSASSCAESARSPWSSLRRRRSTRAPATASAPASRTRKTSVTTIDLQTVERGSDGAVPPRRPEADLRLFALRAVLGGVHPRFLSHVLGLVSARLRHPFGLLVRTFALQLRVVGHVTRGLLASPEQSIEKTRHLSPPSFAAS